MWQSDIITGMKPKKLFPKRKPDTHKGDYGKVFILAGSVGMLGAAILASRAALRGGAGIVYLGVPRSSRDIVNIATPEIIVLGGDSASDFFDLARGADAIAAGPGLGARGKIAKELLARLGRAKYDRPIVLDADGLTAFENDLTSLGRLRLNLILTPHPGEMGKLFGKTAEQVQVSRSDFAANLSKQTGGVTVLKGHNTVISDRSGKTFTNRSGNPGMATAGTGDVLTGLIASFAAQGFEPIDAARTGVFVHGLAGDLAGSDLGEIGMIASDIIKQIPKAIKKVQ